jgi:hypothetical protein
VVFDVRGQHVGPAGSVGAVRTLQHRLQSALLAQMPTQGLLVVVNFTASGTLKLGIVDRRIFQIATPLALFT